KWSKILLIRVRVLPDTHFCHFLRWRIKSKQYTSENKFGLAGQQEAEFAVTHCCYSLELRLWIKSGDRAGTLSVRKAPFHHLVSPRFWRGRSIASKGKPPSAAAQRIRATISRSLK